MAPGTMRWEPARSRLANSSIAGVETSWSPAAWRPAAWAGEIWPERSGWRIAAMARNARIHPGDGGRADRTAPAPPPDRRRAGMANRIGGDAGCRETASSTDRWAAARHIGAAEADEPQGADSAGASERSGTLPEPDHRRRQHHAVEPAVPMTAARIRIEAPIEWASAKNGGGQSGSTTSRMKVSRSTSYSGESCAHGPCADRAARGRTGPGRANRGSRPQSRASCRSRTSSKYFSMNSVRPWNRHTVPLRPAAAGQRAKRIDTPSASSTCRSRRPRVPDWRGWKSASSRILWCLRWNAIA